MNCSINLIHQYFDAPSYQNREALIHHCNEKFAQILADKKKINDQDQFGNTILHYLAVMHFDQEQCERLKWLIEEGADLTIRNKNRANPLAYLFYTNSGDKSALDKALSVFKSIIDFQPDPQLIKEFLQYFTIYQAKNSNFTFMLTNECDYKDLSLEGLTEISHWFYKYSKALNDEDRVILYEIDAQILRLKDYPNIVPIIEKIVLSEENDRRVFITALLLNHHSSVSPGFYNLIEIILKNEKIMNIFSKNLVKGLNKFLLEYENDRNVLEKYNLQPHPLNEHEVHLVNPIIDALTDALFLKEMHASKNEYIGLFNSLFSQNPEQIQYEQRYQQFGKQHAQKFFNVLTELKQIKFTDAESTNLRSLNQ